MPTLPPTSIGTRKRTRSTNVSESHNDHHLGLSAHAIPMITTTTAAAASNTHASTSASIPSANAPPKRQRNNPPPTGPPPPVAPRTAYSLRNRSLTPDPRHPLTRFPSLHSPPSRPVNRQRYNLRPRRPQSQIRLPHVSTPHPLIPPRRLRPPIPPIIQATSLSLSSPTNGSQVSSVAVAPPPSSSSSTVSPAVPAPPVMPSITLPTPPAVQPRQYRLVYISDDDDEPQATAAIVNTALDLVTDDEDDEFLRPQSTRLRSSRILHGPSMSTRSRTVTNVPSSAASTASSSSGSSSSTTTTINTQDFINGVAYVRLNRAIEIVIDSIQSLEGAVNSFDQLIFGLIYGRLGTRADTENIEGMIRLSRILNLNLNIPSRLTQDEIDALPKIIFANKSNTESSALLVEKCPICLTEFDDQETINKLHCTHLFHLQCIATWLSENDSCPTCRRKVMGE